MESVIYRAKQGEHIPSFLGKDLSPNNIEVFTNHWQHPGSISPPRWSSGNTQAAFAIYTDGSKINSQVGAAFCTFGPDGDGEHLYRLNDHCSVFQAELTALHQALRWKRSNWPSEHFHIFSDSLSSLKAINKLRPKNNLVEDVRNLCDNSISLHWVKAHIGVAGNEAADRAAKRASEKPDIDIHLGVPERSFRTTLRKLLHAEWQIRWNTDRNGRFTQQLLKEVKPSRCISNTYISQLVTNHGLCPQYLKRFNLKNCNCRCGEDTQDDVPHYVFSCPLTSHLRTSIKRDTRISQILADKRLETEVVQILSYVYHQQESILELVD
ncbi:hypothetical protein AVEN_182476-1 [Araneus ventricosus]|uniref:ribonuclease H n=1 Tax=Araneus ventricosus TaxID=182803 RepID=A0A4Y2K507_ARAVE|nr:hypothetical protein AVEN_182476-1 [Araneus ventricosus]